MKKKTNTEAPPQILSKYTVVRDSREQPGNGWVWVPSTLCSGTVVKALKTGDYTLEGLEKLFVIERKKNVAEFAGNILQKRFENELIRLEDFAHPFLILEFDLNDMMRWPVGSGIPYRQQKKMKITNTFILKRFMDITLQYKVKVILAGQHGKAVATSLFKRMFEKYKKEGLL